MHYTSKTLFKIRQDPNMTEIKVIKSLNHQSSIEVHFEVINLDKVAYIEGFHERNNIRSPTRILRMKHANSKFNRHSYIKNQETLTLGMNIFKFKYPTSIKKWNSRSNLIVSIYDNSMKQINNMTIRCPANKINKNKMIEESEGETISLQSDDDSDDHLDGETSDFLNLTKRPNVSQMNEEDDSNDDIQDFHIDEIKSLSTIPVLPVSSAPPVLPSFWELVQIIDPTKSEQFKSEQCKLLDKEIQLEEAKINELKVELRKREQLLEEARTKKRRIEQISKR